MFELGDHHATLALFVKGLQHTSMRAASVLFSANKADCQTEQARQLE